MSFVRFFTPAIAPLSASLIAADPVAHGDGKAETGAKDAMNAIKSFKMDAGVKAELFAAEPRLANPVAFYPDEKGRWYVAETYRQEGRVVNGKGIAGGVVDNRGHMGWLNEDIAARTTEDRLAMMRKHYKDPKKFTDAFETHEERIVRVEDADGDGRAEKSTVFADGFREALDGTGAGILVRGGEVWWTCIPHLWRFRDSDGDGRAEAREKLLSGFGVKFAFRGHDMHGLRFGPDGKLYWTIGDRGLNVKDLAGRQWELPDTGAVLRSNPDGTDFEVFATGIRNPQELAFDEWGNLFTGDNNSDGGDRARFVQLVEGGDSGWRMAYQYLEDRGPWNNEMLWDEKEAIKARYLIPPIANLSNGPSGLTYNPGTGLGKRYTGQFYLSDFRGGASVSVVHQIALEPAGAWHRVKERRDFVKGILTTDVEFGPDGALYVLDWVESWSGVDKGRIYRFTAPDRDEAAQKEVQRLLAEGFEKRDEAELSKLLAHADQRVRQAAQFTLAARNAAPVLAAAASKGSSTLARVHGVWGLGQVAGKDKAVLTGVAALLSDGDAEVRAQAARVLGDHRFAGANSALLALLTDAHPRARFYAALALGKAGHKQAVPALVELLASNADQDPLIRHAAIMGLAGCADPEQLAALSSHGSAPVRGGAVVALRRQKSPQVAAFLNDLDASVVLEAARAIHDTPIAAAMPALADLAREKRIKNPNISKRIVNAHYRLGQPENARALAALAADAGASESARRAALDALADWAKPDAKDRVLNHWSPLPERGIDAAVAALVPVYPALFKDAPGSVQESAAKALARLRIPGSGDVLLAVAINDKAPRVARAEALHALAAMRDGKLGEAAKVAITDSDPKLRAEGLKALVAADPEAALKIVAEVLSSNAPVAEKQGAITALAASKSLESEKLLGGLMDQLIAGKLAPEVQLNVYEAAKKRPGLSAKMQQWKAALPKEDPLANYRISLYGGDAVAGKKVFREHQTAQCFKCHKCEGGDSLVGPELTRIGASLSRDMLMEGILYPNKTIAKGFQIVVLEMKDGMTVAGRLLEENAGNLKVETVDNAGKPQAVTVAIADIKTRTSAPSPMPEAIRDQLSRSELRDLIEYLATRK